MTATAGVCPVDHRALFHGDATTEVKPFSAMPGSPGLPFFGRTLDYYRDPNRLFDELYRRYGPVWRTRLLWVDIVCVCGPDADEYVLMNRSKVFSNEKGYEFPIGKLFRGGIMLKDGETHRRERLIMQQAFNKEPLQQYLEQMNPDISRYLDRWVPRYRNGARIHFYPTIKETLLRLAVPVFVGERPGRTARQLNRAITDVVNASGAFLRFDVPGTKFGRGLAGRRYLEQYFGSRIAERRNSDMTDMFSQMCRAESEEGHRLTEQQIIDHMIFLLFAAHDTNTIALTTMFYQLGRNRELQQRLREESLALGVDQVGWEYLGQLEGISRVFKESLRWIAPVPSLFRATTKDTVIGGYEVPRNTIVIVQPSHTHRMEEFWRCPMEFDPDRFSPERREDRVHKFAWVPFGGGVHKCLGRHFAENQAKALVHQALLKYEWHVPEQQLLEMDYSSTPKPKDRLPIRFRRRN